MKAFLIMLILGVVLIVEGIFVSKRSSARQRAAAGGVIGSYLGYKHSRPENKVVGGIFGGVGGAAFGAAYPLIDFLLGGLFLIGAIIVLFNWEYFNRDTMCGYEKNQPAGVQIIGNWTDYKCMDKKTAGAKWKSCLQRSKYSNTSGEGCPGEDLCCPSLAYIPIDPKTVTKPFNKKGQQAAKKKYKKSRAEKDSPDIDTTPPIVEPNPIDQYLRESPPSN